MTDIRASLTPLERLRLRETLQDRWRDQVRRITELSVDLHTALDDRDERPELDSTRIAVELSDARLRLVELEQAMRRLDERDYGRCHGCLVPLPFNALIAEPETRHCDDCRRASKEMAPTWAPAR